MDLASVFYILGILFFVTCFFLLFAVVASILTAVHKVNKLKGELPVKVVSFLKDNNSTQLRAFGIALVGYVLSFLRGKVQSRKRPTP